ncbi:MAG: hypothetical protein OHK0056_26630 [Bacteriovoracaceae bacterium]
MTKPYDIYCGIYMQEHGQKFLFFLKDDMLHMNNNGTLCVLVKDENEQDCFRHPETKLRIKFNKTSHGLFHFIDLHYPDRHTIAIRQFPLGALEDLLRFGRVDAIAFGVIIIGLILMFLWTNNVFNR